MGAYLAGREKRVCQARHKGICYASFLVQGRQTRRQFFPFFSFVYFFVWWVVGIRGQGSPTRAD